MARTLPHVLRSDAQDNRDRVLEAARELFSESGLGVTMRQIARRAGVGPATLYRRFPTKQELVLEAFMDEFRACTAIVREAAADPDPWRGFCSVIERVTVLNARNQGFTDAFMAEYPNAIDFATHRAALTREIAAISYRAIAVAGLRPSPPETGSRRRAGSRPSQSTGSVPGTRTTRCRNRLASHRGSSARTRIEFAN